MYKRQLYESGKTRTKYLPDSAQLPSLGVKNSNLNIAIFFAVIAAVILYIVLNKTTFGYELRATGFNKDAAEYAGMKSKRNIMLTMSLAGMLAGLGGAFAILAPSTIAGDVYKRQVLCNTRDGELHCLGVRGRAGMHEILRFV